MSHINLKLSTDALPSESSPEVFYCIICGSQQPKLQKFLNDSSQSLSNYFCNLYGIKNTSNRLDVELTFRDSLVCSQCNQELRDVETLYSQVERLKSEIQRIKVSCKSKLKDFSVESEPAVGRNNSRAPDETRQKHDKLYNYAFVRNARRLDVVPVITSVISSDPNFTSTATEEASEEFGFDGFDFPDTFDIEVDEDNEAADSDCDTIDKDPLKVDTSVNAYSSLSVSVCGSPQNHGEKNNSCAFEEKCESDDSSKTDRAELPFLILKNEVEEHDGSLIELKGSNSDAWRRKYELRELSINVERIQMPANSMTMKIPPKPKRRYAKRESGTAIRRKTRPFACPYQGCVTTFVLELQLEGHVKRIHEGVRKPFKCEVCNRKFALYPELRDHQNLHKGLTPYKCPTCEESFAFKNKLLYHRRTAHNPNPPPQKEKPKRNYPSRESGKNQFKLACPHSGCCSTFLLEVQRDGHIKKVHEGVSKPFNCEICNRTFLLYTKFADHQNVHKGLTPYSCSKCDKSFSTRIQCRYHLRKVHNENSFRCEICGKGLVNKLVLQNHMRSHTKERPFICEICGRSFTQRDILRNHRLTHPELNLGVPQCKFCGKVFAGGKYYLKMHERRHMGINRFKCELCNFGTSLKTSFTKHLASHSDKRDFECDVCNHKFKTACVRNLHKRDYHPASKDFMCSECGKCFSCNKYLQRHLEIHKEIKRLLCTRCGKSFAQTTSYKYHMRHHHKDENVQSS